eukprot:Nitzschia sp. Nitz4//scaffold174_size87051//30805//32613//NITZ4_005107-RA/size87051-processed-gene-0.63-mRNA-1//1//CDS//3329538866//3314//frame0
MKSSLAQWLARTRYSLERPLLAVAPANPSGSRYIQPFSTRSRTQGQGGGIPVPPPEDPDDDVDDNEEVLVSDQPWKGLLEMPARAAWRVSHVHPPEGLVSAVKTILDDGDRTPKQLKRAHRQVLERHTILAEFRERERRRLVNGKYYRGKDRAEESVLNPVTYGYDQTLATLKHRLPANYAVTRRVLEECKSLLGPEDFAPERIVDFGIGCGSASAAALDLFPDSVQWIHGIDPSQPMRDCSQKLLETMVVDESSIPPRVTFSTALSNDQNESSSGSFDLALCAYSATDLPDVGSTLAAAAMLFQKLKPNGVLVVIEPGTPDGFNSIRAIRNMLLDCCPPHDEEFEWEERCHIVAPCTHNGPCPMVRHKKDFNKKGKLGVDLPQEWAEEEEDEPRSSRSKRFMQEEEDDDGDDFLELEDFMEEPGGPMSETEAFNSSFCSFVQAMPGSDSRKGEKFSYLVAQKRVFGREDEGIVDPFPMDNVTELLATAHNAAADRDGATVQKVFANAQDLQLRYFDSDEDDLGLELLRGEEKRTGMGRIVRAPIKKKGHVYIDYCAAPGRIIRSRVAKSSSQVAPGMWTAARKSRWGGLWPDYMDKTSTNT